MADLTFGAEVVKDGNGTAVTGGIKAFTDPNDSNRKGAVVAVVTADGTVLRLGQALAAASVPVVLTAAQITSLTAPVLAAGTAIVGKVTTDQTTHGTTDLVAADITKVNGAAVPVGHGVAATALRVELPTDGTGQVSVKNLGAGSYETVAASQTDQALGATGATGDYLAGVLIVPATTSPGAVSIKDGSGSAITVFTGGASSVSNLVPFLVPLGVISTGGAWKVTTGSNVSAIGVGSFT